MVSPYLLLPIRQLAVAEADIEAAKVRARLRNIRVNGKPLEPMPFASLSASNTPALTDEQRVRCEVLSRKVMRVQIERVTKGSALE